MENKQLVGTHWSHNTTGERWVIKEQFRVGTDIECWVDLRNADNVCTMLRTDQLVLLYSKIVLEFQNTD
jgi:hypothetical protein